MKSGKELRLKRNTLILSFLEVSLITIGTLIFLSILQISGQIWYPESPFLMKGITTIILMSFVSALFAYICSLPGRLAIIQKLTEERNKLENHSKQVTRIIENLAEKINQGTAERMLMEKALSESESRFREVIQKAPIGIVLLDNEGIIMDCNPVFQKILGYADEELIGVRFSQVIHPDDLAHFRERFNELLEGKSNFYRIEHRYIHKDFQEIWGLLSSSIVKNNDGQPKFFIAVIEDITQRRQAEEQVLNYQKLLRSLTSESSLTEEHTRRRLATDLHDNIGQVLSLIKIKISELEESLSNNVNESLLKEISNSIEQTIRYTRYLMFEISPPILYDLGLEETIEWLAEHFAKQHGIQIQLMRDQQTKQLNTETSILLFQAVRELLSNIVKHANATLVIIIVNSVGNKLKVIVEDNGVGLDPILLEPQLNQTKGLGLFSISERLGYLEGSIEIESEPGQGTKVTLLIPLESKKIRWSHFKNAYLQSPRV